MPTLPSDLIQIMFVLPSQARLLPHGELRRLITKHYALERSPRDEWDKKEDELAAIFVGFRKAAKPPPTA